MGIDVWVAPPDGWGKWSESKLEKWFDENESDAEQLANNIGYGQLLDCLTKVLGADWESMHPVTYELFAKGSIGSKSVAALSKELDLVRKRLGDMPSQRLVEWKLMPKKAFDLLQKEGPVVTLLDYFGWNLDALGTIAVLAKEAGRGIAHDGTPLSGGAGEGAKSPPTGDTEEPTTPFERAKEDSPRFSGAFTGLWFWDSHFAPEEEEKDHFDLDEVSAKWTLEGKKGEIEGKGKESSGEAFSFKGEYDASGRFRGTKKYGDRSVRYDGVQTARMLVGKFSLGREGSEEYTSGCFFLVPEGEAVEPFAETLGAFGSLGGALSFGIATYGRWLGREREALLSHLGSGEPPVSFERLQAEKSAGSRTKEGEPEHWKQLQALDALVRGSGYLEECAATVIPMLRTNLQR